MNGDGVQHNVGCGVLTEGPLLGCSNMIGCDWLLLVS